MEIGVEQRLEILHNDLSEMKRLSKENQEHLRREVQSISDKISNFAEKFAHLDGLNYTKQIDKLEENEKEIHREIDGLKSYQNKTMGAVAVLYVVATALVGAVVKWLLDHSTN